MALELTVDSCSNDIVLNEFLFKLIHELRQTRDKVVSSSNNDFDLCIFLSENCPDKCPEPCGDFYLVTAENKGKGSLVLPLSFH